MTSPDWLYMDKVTKSKILTVNPVFWMKPAAMLLLPEEARNTFLAVFRRPGNSVDIGSRA